MYFPYNQNLHKLISYHELNMFHTSKARFVKTGVKTSPTHPDLETQALPYLPRP